MSSSLDALLKLSKTSSSRKMFEYDCATLYRVIQCDAMHTFHKPTTSLDKFWTKKTFARREYVREDVFNIMMRTLFQKIYPLKKCTFFQLFPSDCIKLIFFYIDKDVDAVNTESYDNALTTVNQNIQKVPCVFFPPWNEGFIRKYSIHFTNFLLKIFGNFLLRFRGFISRNFVRRIRNFYTEILAKYHKQNCIPSQSIVTPLSP